MYYDRQIKYFDYKKNGVRLKGAGYLKIEIRDENCNFSMQISGLQSAENSTGKVYGLWEDREEMLGNILLQGGRGSKELGITRSSIPLAIRIPMRDDSELYCQISNWEQTSAGRSVVTEEVLGEGKKQEERAPGEESEKETPMPVKMAVEEKEAYAEQKVSKTSDYAEVAEVEKTVTDVSETQRELVEAECELPEKASVVQKRRMLEEKWEQLWAVYPHLTPFEDEREYLQIGLGDFVILRERFYRLVHNSFLLHGFYNYQHLILTRLDRRGENFYYIGVPGNFYDREKQVAVMYGFESFECAKEPAGQGDFGYYMIRVEL